MSAHRRGPRGLASGGSSGGTQQSTFNGVVSRVFTNNRHLLSLHIEELCKDEDESWLGSLPPNEVCVVVLMLGEETTHPPKPSCLCGCDTHSSSRVQTWVRFGHLHELSGGDELLKIIFSIKSDEKDAQKQRAATLSVTPPVHVTGRWLCDSS